MFVCCNNVLVFAFRWITLSKGLNVPVSLPLKDLPVTALEIHVKKITGVVNLNVKEAYLTQNWGTRVGVRRSQDMRDSQVSFRKSMSFNSKSATNRFYNLFFTLI